MRARNDASHRFVERRLISVRAMSDRATNTSSMFIRRIIITTYCALMRSSACVCMVVAMLAIASCHAPEESDVQSVGSVAQALTDTDSDDLDDDWEILHFGNLSQNGSGGARRTLRTVHIRSLGFAPGVYTGAANLNSVSLSSAKPKFLVIGLEGASKTIVDGGGSLTGWSIGNTSVIASLTIRRTTRALHVSASSSEVRLVDLLVRDNASPTWATGLHVSSVGRVDVVGSTFLDNTGTSTAHQIHIGGGNALLMNTVVWGTASGTTLYKSPSATLTEPPRDPEIPHYMSPATAAGVS